MTKSGQVWPMSSWMSPEAELVASLCCTPLSSLARNRAAALAVTPIDWDRFFALAARMQVEPVAMSNLRVLGEPSVPRQVRERAAEKERESRGLALSRTLLMNDLLDRFDEAGIPVIVLKGPALGVTAYGDPSMRTFGDIDLLVQRPDLRPAGELLIQLGYTRDYPSAAENQLIEDEHALEFSSARSCPEVPIVRLRASLGGNSASTLEHGVVIDLLLECSEADFCIQDADCFVTNPMFWDGLTLDHAGHYAAGPFFRDSSAGKPEFPETFLLLLNSALFRRYRSDYGLEAETTSAPGSAARRRLELAGYPPGTFIETLKNYYDTLQQYWVVSKDEGFTYNRVPGENNSVFHIGGTSYLHHDFSSLEHWDYWPLNVQYLHLRLLSLPGCDRFRSRFQQLLDFHDSAESLLARFPEFASGWRRRQTDDLLVSLSAADVLA